MTETMSPKERAAKFREHYACSGRDMPKRSRKEGMRSMDREAATGKD